MIKGKKAVSHVEIVLSFILFFLFVIFLLLFLKPISTKTTLSGSVISALHDSFKEEVYTNYTKVFLKANDTDEQPCFYIEVDGRVFVYKPSNSIVYALDGQEVDSSIQKQITSYWFNIAKSGAFYKVLISPDFDESSFGCTNKLGTYSLGSIDEKQIVSYNTLLELKNRYDNDYINLKRDLKFPLTFDFAVVSDLIKMERVIPDAAEVKANDYIEEILFDNGTIINQRFTIKVW